MINKQEVLDVLECFRRNTAHILGDNDEKVKTIETCVMLVQEAEEAEKWIPVSEANPEKCDYYLVTDSGLVGEAYYDSDRRWWADGNKLKDVTAWMPLPEAFKEDEE